MPVYTCMLCVCLCAHLCVCVCPIWQVRDYNSGGFFNAYWAALFIALFNGIYVACICTVHMVVPCASTYTVQLCLINLFVMMNGVPISDSPLLTCTTVCGPLCIVGLATTCTWPWWLGTGLLCLVYDWHFVVLGSVPTLYIWSFFHCYAVSFCPCTLSVMLGWLAGVCCGPLHFWGPSASIVLPCLRQARGWPLGCSPGPLHHFTHPGIFDRQCHTRNILPLVHLRGHLKTLQFFSKHNVFL